MSERSRRSGEVFVRVRLRAFIEGVPFGDPRVVWAREQAALCVAEGMPAGEAVRLAWDVAFRCYGQEPPARGT